jgi:Domain of unknown function (DUF4157)
MGLTVKNLVCHVRVTLPLETVGAPGRPLDVSTLSRMEGLLGDQFDDVRVHTDSSAGTLARGLGADAFISGRDIYFGLGRFETVTGRGLGLVAHELVHRQQEKEGTVGAEAEQEAMRVEREAATHGRPQEAVYLEGEVGSGDGADEEKKAEEIERVRQPEVPSPGAGNIEQLVTAKVMELMRSEVVIERERRGLTPGSGGRIPL